jgi:NAD(P)-dependent dehydrogenase (short-subunit alcohol dehydrogenase family)
MRLANKIGLVTAAGSGMGRAGVIRFAKEGAKVAVVDLDQAAVDAAVAEIEAAAASTASPVICAMTPTPA